MPFAKKSWTFFEKLGRMSEKLSVFSKKQPIFRPTLCTFEEKVAMRADLEYRLGLKAAFCKIDRHFCRERPEKYMKKHAVARQ